MRMRARVAILRLPTAALPMPHATLPVTAADASIIQPLGGVAVAQPGLACLLLPCLRGMCGAKARLWRLLAVLPQA